MKHSKVIIIVEGQTEEEFVNESLRPWLNNHSIYDVRAIKIRTSQTGKGGSANYQKFKNDVSRLLNQQNDVLITSLIDFFRLPTSFPGYEEALRIPNVERRVEFLENALAEEINSERFLPYIQLHEFEALLFTRIAGFKALPDLGLKEIAEIKTVMELYPNPELINDNPTTAPSKRLEQIYPGYKKVLHGNFIILENTFQSLLEKCPRFRNWVECIVVKADILSSY